MHINRRALFIKVHGMLCQTWAVTKPYGVVLYMNDLGKVIDKEQYPTKARAVAALRRKGFDRFADDRVPRAQAVA
jgi:hypothetical protein